MDFILSRRGGVPVRDQLVRQLELKLLAGELGPGARLPSVRALARRLKLHPNTVSAAYRDLEAAGHVELRRGSGVFVRGAGPVTLLEARGLDEMIRMALYAAFSKGHSGAAIRKAVERWLRATPPEKLMVVDPSPEMAELLVHELRQSLEAEASCCALDQVGRDPSLLSGSLALCLPYHVETLRGLAPDAAIETITLEVPAREREALLALPPGAIVLVVSHSPTVLPFASILLRSLRGDEVLVEARLLARTREWRRVVGVADLVLADALSIRQVASFRPRRLHEVRFVPERVLARLRDTLTVVVPAMPRS